MKITKENILQLCFIKNGKLYRVKKFDYYFYETLYGLYDTDGYTIQAPTKNFEEIVLYLYSRGYNVFRKIEDLEFKEVY